MVYSFVTRDIYVNYEAIIIIIIMNFYHGTSTVKYTSKHKNTHYIVHKSETIMSFNATKLDTQSQLTISEQNRLSHHVDCCFCSSVIDCIWLRFTNLLAEISLYTISSTDLWNRRTHKYYILSHRGIIPFVKQQHECELSYCRAATIAGRYQLSAVGLCMIDCLMTIKSRCGAAVSCQRVDSLTSVEWSAPIIDTGDVSDVGDILR